jgi:hypothetical protein
MATRRTKMFTCNKYVQPLKVGFKRPLLLNMNCDYFSVMTKVGHRAVQDSDYSIKSWLRFNSNTFDGIQVMAGLLKGNRFKSIGTCTFKIYAVGIDNTWTEVLLAAASGTSLPDGRFSAIINQATLDPTTLDGEITLKMEVEVTRQDKTYSDAYFFNHVGIYDSFIRLKQDVEFLEVTKLDE